MGKKWEKDLIWNEEGGQIHREREIGWINNTKVLEKHRKYILCLFKMHILYECTNINKYMNNLNEITCWRL